LVEIEDCKLKVLLEKYQKTSEEKYEQMNEDIKQTKANENNSDESLKNANLAKESGINAIIQAELGKCSLEIAKIRETTKKPIKPADPTQYQLTKEQINVEILNAKRAAKVAMETATPSSTGPTPSSTGPPPSATGSTPPTGPSTGPTPSSTPPSTGPTSGGKKTLKRKHNYLKKRKFNSLKKHKRYKQ